MDVEMQQSPPAPPADGEPKYGGFSRFEIELEFVQSLANPFYLNHLASQKLLNEPAFIAYLSYLRYWTRPPYIKYLNYPGPTLKHLELLQEERFRQEIISPELVQALAAEGTKASTFCSSRSARQGSDDSLEARQGSPSEATTVTLTAAMREASKTPLPETPQQSPTKTDTRGEDVATAK
ncbi:SOH1-domain-containing protein [Hypoxylon trugodes]|uniref:SOH1-domain-containing protein n=1 Tax=Hypoxylon trugodes TaxID=326681 RepID=UPI00218D61E1|nr:SOH1-domain-containing protein [Hypoxylon trugodes]KAI1392332.1 SOH1-domain-containing protein [Hypoxylon trugodes]